jgi:hypothetical protein
MTAVEQVVTAGPEFTGEMERRDALAKATEDQEQPTGPMTDSCEFGACIDVEYRAALPTTILDNGRPMAVVGRLIGWQGMPVRAAQALGVQRVEQHLIAPLLIEEILDWKQHHASSVSTEPGSASVTVSVEVDRAPR